MNNYTYQDCCKFDDCTNTAIFYLVYGCIEQHIADTTICRDHLKAVKTLVTDRKFRCGQCPRPVISGLYRLIHSNAKRICTRNLTGNTVKITDNPEYNPPKQYKPQHWRVNVRALTDAMGNINSHAPSPDIKDGTP